MATRPDVNPAGRGARSRGVVLRAAERVMAEHAPCGREGSDLRVAISRLRARARDRLLEQLARDRC